MFFKQIGYYVGLGFDHLVFHAPGPDQAERIEFPGYGVPDLPGFDPTPQTPNCG